MEEMPGVYRRWRKGEPRRGEIFPSPGPNDTRRWGLCLLCGHTLRQNVADRGLQLIALFPIERDRERFERGEIVVVHTLIVHAYCAGNVTDAELDELAGSVRRPHPLLP